jgi:hypothetical protein
MTVWPSRWRNRTLESSGLDVTSTSLKVLAEWRKSTPLLPWTNNPLGIPASSGHASRVPHTLYAAYPSITDFYAAFAAFAKTPKGRELSRVLASDDGYGAIWRVISSLKWPASKTETDYPALVLDLAGESYRASVNAKPIGERKTSGASVAPVEIHNAIRAQARSVTEAAAAFGHSRQAVQFLIRRHARNG